MFVSSSGINSMQSYKPMRNNPPEIWFWPAQFSGKVLGRKCVDRSGTGGSRQGGGGCGLVWCLAKGAFFKWQEQCAQCSSGGLFSTPWFGWSG